MQPVVVLQDLLNVEFVRVALQLNAAIAKNVEVWFFKTKCTIIFDKIFAFYLRYQKNQRAVDLLAKHAVKQTSPGECKLA